MSDVFCKWDMAPLACVYGAEEQTVDYLVL